MEHGYAFHWDPYCTPILVCPGGDKVIHLDVEHYVPFLTRGTEAQPAVPALEDAGASSSSGPSGDAAPECALAVEDAIAEQEEGDPPGRDLKAEAVSREHLMTHMPKNKWCPACQRAKMQHKACRRGSTLGPVPESFGDQVTADHIVSRSEASQGLTGEKNAPALLDRATGYIERFPLGTKSSSDTWDAFNEFLGPNGYIRSLYTDDSPELERTWRLFLETHQENVAAMASGELTPNLSDPCRARTDYRTGLELPADRRIMSDPNGTVRTWHAVVFYMLSDFRFLYE
jgi:hypothetical protein